MTTDHTKMESNGQEDAWEEAGDLYEFPASFAQRRLWFLDRLTEEGGVYNVPAALRLRGRVHHKALAESLAEVVRRHETLRTFFEEVDGELLQVVDPSLTLHMEEIDLRGFTQEERDDQVLNLARAEALQPFDLSQGPLLRAALIQLADEEHVLLLTIHHIVSDGWSMGVLIREIAGLYAAFATDRPSPLPELPIQYGDYAEWQQQFLQGEGLREQLAYWQEQLAGELPVLQLPADRPRPARQSYRGGAHKVVFSAETKQTLLDFSRREGSSLYMTMLAAFKALLHRYTGQTDLLVGSPVAGRTRTELEGLIGFFVNTLVMRNRVTGEETFRELVRQVSRTSFEAFARQDVPFEKLVEVLQPERSQSYSPLFQVLFVLQNAPTADLALPGVEIERLEVESEVAKFDLTLTVEEDGDALTALFEYNVDLFDLTTIERMGRQFQELLLAAVADPERQVIDLPLLPADERERLLVTWNDTARRLGPADSGDETAPRLFARQAASTPDAVAVECGETRLTYRELNQRANALAHHLQKLGVGAESLVGLSAERSPEMVVGLLGILKAGGAYVPLDPQYPGDRLSYMLEDAGLSVLLTQEHLLEHLPLTDQNVILLDREWPVIAQESVTEPDGEILADQLAYVIYTSGSTGRPKGVLVEHRGLRNLAYAQIEAFALTEASRQLQFASFSFDASVSEVFTALLAGATLVLATDEERMPGPELGSLLLEKRITTVTLPPSALAVLPEHPYPDLQTVISAGEACSAEIARRWSAGRRFLNAYGPTEATVCASYAVYTDDPGERPPTIGRPLANTELYILDRRLRPVPVGVSGELYIGGVGLARGYRHRPDLTEQAFVPHPFKDQGRLYKTGDLARWLPDGTVEYIGRLDDQVKIRGFRIELGEVEAVLNRHPHLSEAVAVVREDATGDKRLVAYVTLAEGRELDTADLRRLLREELPDYMVPSRFVLLDAMPLTPNGKVDRKSLPAPDRSRQSASGYVAPGTPLEECIATVFAEVLGIERVGAEDDFFHLGGHSLLATQAVSRLQNALEQDVPLRLLFAAPTVRDLAQQLGEREEGDRRHAQDAIQPAAGDGALHLSFAQERLWFLDRYAPGESTYNMPTAVRLCGDLDLTAFEKSLEEIVRRHAALRTTFAAGERPTQVIADELAVPLFLDDLRALPETEREERSRALLQEEALRPFDLAAGPLIRASLYQMDEQESLFLLTLHHIVSDGWSMGVFLQELAALYEAFVSGRPSPLSPLPIQYADYAAWQRERLEQGGLDASLDYWKEQFRGEVPILHLPTDRPRPAVRSGRGGHRAFVLPQELTARLNQLGQTHGATLFMVLLSGYKAMLHRYTGQDDLVVGTPIAGRNRAELERLIGFFINTLALRTDLAGNPSFTDLLARVRDVTLAAYEHQDVPFEKVVEEVQPERIEGVTPLFQTMFVLQNAPLGPLALPDLRLEPVELELNTAKFDLSFFLAESEAGLEGRVEYDADLFEAATIDRMIGHYVTLLTALAAEPSQKIGHPSLLTGTEAAWLAEQNNTSTAYPADQSLSELFEKQAAQTPERIALAFDGGELTYREVNERANQLARELLARGVEPGMRVGLCLHRSPELIVSLLAILKAGGAYVPLDPSYPKERLQLMLDDCEIRVLIAAADLQPELPTGTAHTICPEAERERIAGHSTTDLPPAAAPNGIAYVMYTSGSTGRPKGVLVPHRAVVRLVKETDFADFSPEHVFLLFAPISFDASTLEIFGPLLNGGKLVLCPSGPLSLEELGEVIGRHRVTTLWLTAGLFHQMVETQFDSLRSVRQLLAGGDVLSVPHVKKVVSQLPGIRLINGYGPTENTTFTACHTVTAPEQVGVSVPIGRPISNTQTYVFDAHGHLAPIGVPGELCVGGDGLADGYLNLPEMTAEKFVQREVPAVGMVRLYRTGDLVRWLPDGTLEFLGRIDGQVKIRGYRIEPGEIETALLALPSIREAAVVVREDVPGDKRLVAYTVGATHADDELRDVLRETLPDYLIPASFVRLDTLPLNPNGKVDRRALPVPEREDRDLTSCYVAPRTPLERELCAIWSELLGVQQVGAEDGFFALGGHSLLATRLVSRIKQRYQVDLPLRDLFAQASTVSGLARWLTEQTPLAAAKESADPILPRDRSLEQEQALPLSFAQQRMWVLHRLEDAVDRYQIPGVIRLTGPLDRELLRRTMEEVLARHEALRTVFAEREGRPVQVITAPERVELPFTDLRALEPARREEEAMRLAKREVQRRFDLTSGPLLRWRLIGIGKEEHLLVLSLHHIAADGWAIGLLLREIAAIYTGWTETGASPLPDLPIQYADYALWQRQTLTPEKLGAELSYWKEKLGGTLPILQLPSDRPRPAIPSGRGGTLSFELPGELLASLKELSGREGVTLYMTLLAAFKTLLYRHTGQEDLLVGSPVAGRTRQELEELIGLFMNTLVLRTQLANDLTFRQLMHRVKDTAFEAFAHQSVPFEKVVDELQPQRDLSYTPLFQTMFMLQNNDMSAREMPGLTLSHVDIDTDTAKFDLTLSLTETANGLSGKWEYSADLFDPATVMRLSEHFCTLLAACASEPNVTLGQVQLLTERERHQLLVEWNDTEAETGATQATIHSQFAEQAEKTPDRVAVVFEDSELTYGELNARADALARYLQERGVGPETRVGLYLERSLDMIVGLFGILKAGGAYVPLDPAYPVDRVQFMIRDAGVPLLLTQERLAGRLPKHDADVILIDRDWLEILVHAGERPTAEAGPEHLAYMIYTSGSTGTPKGVMIEHRHAVHFFAGMDERVGCGEEDTLLAVTSICFDISVLELFWTLTRGAKVVVLSEQEAAGGMRREERADSEAGSTAEGYTLGEQAVRHQATMLQATPSLMRIISADERTLNSLRVLETLLLGGEPLPLALASELRRQLPARLINLYGPTEATVWATTHEVVDVPESGTLPIGRPYANVKAYVLDARLQPVPVGVPGELYLGGAGVARGYHLRPELTAERFLPDPFAADGSERIYRTGDLVRYRADGVLEIMGRLDDQVKLRGYRIELGEIEAALVRREDIDSAVAMVREDVPGDKRIVAYLIARDGQTPSVEELRAHLAHSLPEYMVPSRCVLLTEWPLTPNGKIDRKRLPAPVSELVAQDQPNFEPPSTPLEEQIAEVWSQVLRYEPVGRHDHFFDQGGESLLATQLIARLRNALQVEIPLRLLFETPVLSALAARIEQIAGALDSDPAGYARLTALLDELDDLTDEEAAARLRTQGQEVSS